MRAFLIAVVLAASGSAQTPERSLWGSLEPGPFVAGYRSYFDFDARRAFGNPRGPRPILVSIWYPAAETKGEPVKYREYFAPPVLPNFPDFPGRLEMFLLDAVSGDLFQKKRAELDPREQAFLESLVARPTHAYRDAAPAVGRFPIVLYHAGAGGSFEENSVICEYLASYGYVVLTSAFQSRDAKNIGSDRGEPETSWGDLTFLLTHAHGLPFADLVNAGAIGRGAGADYLLEWLGRRHPPLGAVIALDATLAAKRIARLSPQSIPVLVVAPAVSSPDAAAWDRSFPCRAEAAPAHFQPNDFTLHGALARTFQGRAAETRPLYDQLARVIRAFLDANLKTQSAGWQQLLDSHRPDFGVTQRVCGPDTVPHAPADFR